MELQVQLAPLMMSVPLLYLDTYGPDPATGIPEATSALAWLHREKLPLEIYPNDHRNSLRAAYEHGLPKFKNAFKALLSCRSFDLVLQAPSSKPHAKTFAEAAHELQNDIPLLVFSKPATVSSTTGASTAEIKAVLSYTPHIELKGHSHVLLVDDVFNEGKIVTVMIQCLRDSGLDPNAAITVAVPLYVPPTGPSKTAPVNSLREALRSTQGFEEDRIAD